MSMLERWFKLRENGTTVRIEILAGVTTFLTMAYIVFVQPAVLSAAGMDFGAVLVATCLATALGHNFFFAYSVVVAMHVPWQIALGAVAIAGTVFVLTAGIGLREHLITAIPQSLKHAIAAGIGLLIATVGLEWAGLIVASPGTLVTLGDMHIGLAFTAFLMVRGVPGAFLWGILATTAIGLPLGIVRYQGFAGIPPSISPT